MASASWWVEDLFLTLYSTALLTFTWRAGCVVAGYFPLSSFLDPTVILLDSQQPGLMSLHSTDKWYQPWLWTMFVVPWIKEVQKMKWLKIVQGSINRRRRLKHKNMLEINGTTWAYCNIVFRSGEGGGGSGSKINWKGEQDISFKLPPHWSFAYNHSLD